MFGSRFAPISAAAGIVNFGLYVTTLPAIVAVNSVAVVGVGVTLCACEIFRNNHVESTQMVFLNEERAIELENRTQSAKKNRKLRRGVPNPSSSTINVIDQPQ